MSEVIKPVNPPEPMRTPVHSKPIVVNGTRVFTPIEYAWVRRYLPKEYHRELLDGLLLTGMRNVEWEKFIEEDFTWYDETRRSIVIPEYAVLKAKIKVRRRNVLLSDAGVIAIEKLITRQDTKLKSLPPLSMPLRSSWGATLRRAAYKSHIQMPETIVPKSTRKTWESWLLLTYPNNVFQITLSQGHNSSTAMNHYVGLGWSVQEHVEAREYTRGWIQEVPDVIKFRG